MQFRTRTEASITGSLDLWIRWIYYIHDGTMERQGHFGCSREVRFRSWVRCLGWKIRGWTKNDRRCQWVVLHSLTTHINNCHGQTLFNIASCSKAFLSASMGILIDDYANGRNNSPLPEEIKTFNWETKVKHLLLDDWELQDVWASEKANLQDLLSHATGMPRYLFCKLCVNWRRQHRVGMMRLMVLTTLLTTSSGI